MGKVVVAAKIENLEDLHELEKGRLPADQVRTVEVTNALVDTGASILSIPSKLIAQLGLKPVRKRFARTASGSVEMQVYRAVKLTIQGRDCLSDVLELPDDCPVLIGQIPLEALDFVVDPVNGRLTGNPEHGGEHMVDCFWAEGVRRG